MSHKSHNKLVAKVNGVVVAEFRFISPNAEQRNLVKILELFCCPPTYQFDIAIEDGDIPVEAKG